MVPLGHLRYRHHAAHLPRGYLPRAQGEQGRGGVRHRARARLGPKVLRLLFLSVQGQRFQGDARRVETGARLRCDHAREERRKHRAHRERRRERRRCDGIRRKSPLIRTNLLASFVARHREGTRLHRQLLLRQPQTHAGRAGERSDQTLPKLQGPVRALRPHVRLRAHPVDRAPAPKLQGD